MRGLLLGDNAVAQAVAEEMAKSGELLSVMKHHNPGIARLSQKFLLNPKINTEAVALWALAEEIDVAVVTSRTFIKEGVVDELRDAGIEVVGPTRESARLDWDKVYARAFMEEHRIPQPFSVVVRTLEEFRRAVKEFSSYVLKPAHYTQGKGSRFSSQESRAEMERYAKAMLKKGPIILQEEVKGENFVFQAFTDGRDVALTPAVKVLRRLRRVSTGYASYTTGELLPFMDQGDVDKAKAIFKAVLDHLQGFKGVLSIEFLKAESGKLYVTGFNSSFNDPAAINVLPLLKTQLMDVFHSILEGRLMKPAFIVRHVVAKFFYPAGYPERTKTVHFSIDERCLWNFGVKLYFSRVRRLKSGLFSAKSSRAFALLSKAESLKEGEVIINEAGRSCVKGPLVWEEEAFVKLRPTIL